MLIAITAYIYSCGGNRDQGLMIMITLSIYRVLTVYQALFQTLYMDSLEFLGFPETLSRGRVLTLFFSAIFLMPRTVPAMQ